MKMILNKLLGPILAFAGLLLMVLWMAGYFDDKVRPGSTEQPVLKNMPTVVVVRVVEPVFETVPASIEAKQATTISPRILARIEKVHVRAGSLVTKGQLLIELEKSDLQSRVARAVALVDSAAARLGEARLALDRATDLAQKNLIAKSDLDRARANHDVLAGDHSSAEQSLKEAASALEFATITAPIDGRIIDRFAEPGDTAQPGKPILSLYNPLSLRVEANVREQLAVSMQDGQLVEVSIPSKNLVVVSEVEEMVPAGNLGSRSFLVKTRLSAVEGLLPGMYAQLKVPAGTQTLLLVPKPSIQEIGQLEIVSVVADGKIDRRYIRTGKEFPDGMIEVISGLDDGERVLSNLD